MRKTFIAITLGALLFPPISANAQISPGWNMQARERAEAANSQAIGLLNAGQFKKAIPLLQKAIAHDPEDAPPYAILGLALAMQGSYTQALDSLQKAYSLRPSNEILLATGIVYYLQHDYDAAINAYTKILQANPKLCNVYANLGMAYLHKGDIGQAHDVFQHLVRCSPNSDLGYYGLALTHYMSGDFATAKEEAERAAAINSYPPTTLLLAQIDVMQGDRSRAHKRALQYNSEARRKRQPRSMTALGFSPQHDFHWDPYLEDQFDNGYLLLARVESDPRSKALLRRSGRSHQIIDEIKNHLTRFPGDLFLTHDLAMAQIADGDYSSAADGLQSVLKQCPTCAVDLLNLSLAQTLDGKAEQASEHVREFQSRQPRQQVSKLFTEPQKVDPALQAEPEAQKRLPALKKQVPQPVPAGQF